MNVLPSTSVIVAFSSLGGEHREVHVERLRDRALLALEKLPRAWPGNLRADVDRSRHGHGAERTGAPAIRSPRWTPARPRSRPARTVSRRGWRRHARRASHDARGDGARNRVAGRRSVGADGARCKGHDERRITLLHEPREPQGRGARLPTHARPLVLYWEPLDARCGSRGASSRCRRSEAARVLRARGRGTAGIAAWASPQSRPSRPRRARAPSTREAEERFAGVEDVPLPPFWGGYRSSRGVRVLAEPAEPPARPRRYERDGDGWRRFRLAP